MVQNRRKDKKLQKVKKAAGKQQAGTKKGGEKKQTQSAEDLDAALMKYMGVSAQKDALEEQLNAYFSKGDESTA